MKTLHKKCLEAIALGAKVLGSGGGGNPHYPLMIAKQLYERQKPIQIYDVDSIADDSIVAPLCYMGAPLVGIEKIPQGAEFQNILGLAHQLLNRPIDYILPAEIGGGNALAPFTFPNEKGYKILDADLIGRAFPELQMCSGNLYHIPAAPAILSDFMGNTAVINAGDSYTIEKYCRALTVSMGSRAAVGFHFMNGRQAKRALVKGSITRAIDIGTAMLESRAMGKSPIEALLRTIGGKVIASGFVTDNTQKIENGFLKGTVHILTKEYLYQVWYQNEYLAVSTEEGFAASTPDIIMLFEQESGVPITSDSLTYGQRVEIVALPAPEIWTSARGLELVGPKAFNYDIDYETVKF